MVFMGIVLVVLGVIAIAAPIVAGVSITLMLGFVLIAAGLAQVFWAFQSPTFKKGIGVFVWGGLTVLAGAYMVSQPAAALAGLTLFLAIYLFASGLFEIWLAFKIKPAQGWGWTLFTGVVSLLLGIMIWRRFPTSAAFVGMIIGIKLIAAGMMMFGLRAAKGAVEDALEG